MTEPTNQRNRDDEDMEEREITSIDVHNETEEKKANDATKLSKVQLEKIIGLYLDGNPVFRPDGKTNEIEIRFGTNTRESRPLSKIDYDNVVKELRSNGFHTANENGTDILRITPEYTDPKSGEVKRSNMRAEVNGLDLIQEYCRTNDISKILNMPTTRQNKLSFTQKTSPQYKNGEYVKPADFYDHNFRVDFKLEKIFIGQTKQTADTIHNWQNSKKTFRCMNRVKFEHPDMPFIVDLSIIKTSKRKGNFYFAEYTIQDADVFNNPPTYEIEVEFDNKRFGPGTPYTTVEDVIKVIHHASRMILGGIQRTSYPIRFSERNSTLQSYMAILHGDKYQPRRVNHSDFIGPQSNTLQLENIGEPLDGVVNVRTNYTVTDKADGDRRLLFIDGKGRIYLIDMTMNVIFTGSITSEKTVFNTIIDGEHIKMNKEHQGINLFACFDIYYVNGKSVREKGFMPSSTEEMETNYRLPILNAVVSRMKVKSIIPENNAIWRENPAKPGTWIETKTGKTADQRPTITPNCRLRVQCKSFYMTSDDVTIFQGCSTILSNIRDGMFEYETDGLIFTPSNTGVGSRKIGEASKLSKGVWDLSFKWKPAEFNTVDFLVTCVKDKTGKDEIHNVFESHDISQYKVIRLMCGFDEKKHGFINPFNDLIHDKIPDPKDVDNEDTYHPAPFYPSNPYDPETSLCNIRLVSNSEEQYMTTETGEYFDGNMIVEFRYDKEAKHGWKWIPIRVRYDKTAELLRGMKNYGNAYHVANNNWKSIHHEITAEMIETGENIPVVEDDDVYYNRNREVESTTEAMRNFHNLYVKNKLIQSVSNQGDILIDYSVGKAGDLSKWIHSNLNFVFGIDISRDNIEHPVDGACARYLKARKTSKRIPGALFIKGNSSLNIRDGSAFTGDKDSKEKVISRAVFGTGPKDLGILGKGVYDRYGVAEQGFHVSSCQFAMHYFFENQRTLHGFLRNLAECTRLQGYFIGTCYDGKTIFNLLSRKEEGESVVISQRKMASSPRICEIQKMYREKGFPDDASSVGYPISVYQETINKPFREYLVNFKYFVELMEHYGFVLVTRNEARQMGLPNGSGLFGELFDQMENEIQLNPRSKSFYKKAMETTDDEKSLSFMNRYFVFRKMRNVNAVKVSKLLLQSYSELDNEDYDDEMKEAIAKVQRGDPVVKRRIRKLKNAKVTLTEKKDETIVENLEIPESKGMEEESEEEPIEEIINTEVADFERLSEEDLTTTTTTDAIITKPTKAPKAPKVKALKEPKEPKVPKVKVPKEKVVKEPKVPKEPKEPKVKAPKVPKEPKEKVVKVPKEKTIKDKMNKIKKSMTEVTEPVQV